MTLTCLRDNAVRKLVNGVLAGGLALGLVLGGSVHTVMAQDYVLVGMGAEDMTEIDDGTPAVDAPCEVSIRFDDGYDQLTKEDTRGWRSTKGNRYEWHQEWVYPYFQELKEKYDTKGNQVKFITHEGQTIFFESDNCGWKMNVDITVQRFEEAVDAGETITDPAWNSGLVYSSKNGVGDKYVEIDISEQKVFLFEDGKKLLESDCVTGNAGVSETDKGVYQIIYKASPSVLKDESPSGYEYEQPVNYWMAFNGSQGLHDAVWRSDFGGTIYQGNGSYGCVNLPLEAAEQLYYEVYTYYPVIVY